MSRNAFIVEKTLPQTPSPRPPQVAGSTEYAELRRLVLRSRSVLALLGAGSRSRTGEACRGLAAELSASGQRVIIVDVAGLRPGCSPSAIACRPGASPGVWHWNGEDDSSVEFFPRPGKVTAESDWLQDLRRSFDVVLLNCPSREYAEVAAMADAAVLVVEAGETPKQQIQRDQRALSAVGVALAGCVLMRRR